MVIYNVQAIIAAIMGCAFGFGMYSFSRNQNAALVTGFIALIAFDLYSRIGNQEEDTPLLAPGAGGHVWFIPVWIIGSGGLLAAGASWLNWI